jgi:hypothetical protein
MEWAEQRYRKPFAKVDAENRRPYPNNAPYFPERPTGVHHDTFEELVGRRPTGAPSVARYDGRSNAGIEHF